MSRATGAYVYAALDVTFAAFYVWASRTLLPSSDGVFEAISAGFAGAAGAMAVGTLARRRWGLWLAVAGCAALLVGAIALLVLLGMSVGFLWGVYGAIGRGAASLVAVGMALVILLYVLLPAFQLRWLLSEGRPAG
jgi:hypothetical protein